MTVYIPDKDFYFLHIPKAGGTSVRGWINQNTTAIFLRGKHETLEALRQKYNVENYFTIVRNPYARAHSWFRYHIKKAKRWAHKPNRFNIYLEYEEKGFNWWVKNCNWQAGDFGKLQTSFFDNTAFAVCKLENINIEIIPVANLLNITQPLPIANKSDNENWKEAYDETSYKIIQEYFMKDFEELDYDARY